VIYTEVRVSFLTKILIHRNTVFGARVHVFAGGGSQDFAFRAAKREFVALLRKCKY
jgi:hypothetical protein